MRGLVRRPDRDRGLMLLSVVGESTPVWGATASAERLAARVRRGARPRSRRCAGWRRRAAERPPTGFLRDLVLEAGGERKGALDIKHGGLLPIEALARWAALSAGVERRVDAGAPATRRGAAGTLSAADAARPRATRSSSSARCGWSTRSSSCAPAPSRTTSSSPHGSRR